MAVSSPGNPYWQRNLMVCLVGSITTFIAMSILLPFLPLYVQQLGVKGKAAIAQWSGFIYGATFLTAGLIAPLWGKLGDRYGRKPMLVRASMGMATCMALMGCVTSIWQLAGLRLLAGLAGGYSSGATIMVAAQAPRERSAWALGLLSSGIIAGTLIGPLVGGMLPALIGIRLTFLGAGLVIFLAGLTTILLVHEGPVSHAHTQKDISAEPTSLPEKKRLFLMLGTAMLLTLASMSIEPIITLYIQGLTNNPARVTSLAGLVMSATAAGSIISASRLGKLADRIGTTPVITAALAVAGLLCIPQAFVTATWQLVGLRFLMGGALGGIMPCVIAAIRHTVPDHKVGTVLGYSTSTQYAGQVLGPALGGFIGGRIGLRAVFFSTAALLIIAALGNLSTGRKKQDAPS